MIKKYSIKIADHLTSVSLEEEFWLEIKKIAKQKQKTLSQLITEIDEQQTELNALNLSSALRLFVLRELKRKNI